MRKIKKVISVVLAASLLVGTLVTGNISVQAAGKWSVVFLYRYKYQIYWLVL